MAQAGFLWMKMDWLKMAGLHRMKIPIIWKRILGEWYLDGNLLMRAGAILMKAELCRADGFRMKASGII